VSDGSFGPERRTNPRQQYVNFAWYKRIDVSGPGGEEGVAHSCDVSKTGAGLVVGRPLPAGAQLFVELLIRGGRVSMVATVMHCRELENERYRIGIEIDVMPPMDRPIWDTMQETRSPPPT
jgi:hypothetical protein